MNTNLAFQEEIWEEMIDGEIVAMSPRPKANHNIISDNIYSIFSYYLRRKKCRAFSDGMEVFLTEKDHYVPDFMVVCDHDKVKHDGVHGAPDLVAEVLSPRTVKNDRIRKKATYEACGVKEYWIVSPEEKSVEQHLLEDGRLVLKEVYALYPDYTLKTMKEEERAALVTSFKCSLFDDLDIELNDIFDGMVP